MNTPDVINEILLGGLLGILGQGIRVIVGLKKLNTDNVTKSLAGEPKESFSASRLLLSLFIGFVAGAIAMLINGPVKDPDKKDYLIIVMAAGYSGADFIEGIFKKYLPK